MAGLPPIPYFLSGLFDLIFSLVELIAMEAVAGTGRNFAAVLLLSLKMAKVEESGTLGSHPCNTAWKMSLEAQVSQQGRNGEDGTVTAVLSSAYALDCGLNTGHCLSSTGSTADRKSCGYLQRFAQNARRISQSEPRE